MFCAKCGKPILEGARFCQFCGWQVVVSPQPVQQVVQQPVQQVVPQQVQQVVPQPVQQQVPVTQAAPAPAMQPQEMPAPASTGVVLEPLCVTILTPKNAAKERVNLGSSALLYVEIRDNTLFITGKGGTASSMFGALGVLVTAAACSNKPIMEISPNQIRNMSYIKKFGDILQLELIDGKLLQFKTSLEKLNVIEGWWRSQIG